MARIKLNLEGLNTTVDIRAIGAGASLNEIIKKGARQTYKVQEFHDQLMIAKRNILGYRDTILPQELVLEIGVSLLTECYRNPMKILLEDSYEYLKNSIKTVLGDTLGVYQKFEELVGDIILGEIEENKAKAEEYLDLQINLHKRFVNTEHKEFVKSTNVLKKKIRFEPAVDLWFQEGISGDSEENVIEEKKEDEKRKREILEKSLAHEEMIRNLKERQKICIDTMRVIQDTMNQLKLIKKRGSI